MFRGRIALLLHVLGTAIEKMIGASKWSDRLKDRAVRLASPTLRFGG